MAGTGTRAFKEISLKDLRLKRKEELFQLIIDARSEESDDETTILKDAHNADTLPKSCPSCTCASNPTLDQMRSMFEPLLDQLTQHLKQQLTELRAEIHELRSKVSEPEQLPEHAVPSDAASVAPDDGWTVVQERRQKKSFATVVEQSVKAG